MAILDMCGPVPLVRGLLRLTITYSRAMYRTMIVHTACRMFTVLTMSDGMETVIVKAPLVLCSDSTLSQGNINSEQTNENKAMS